MIIMKKTDKPIVQLMVINSNTAEVTSDHHTLAGMDREKIDNFILDTLNEHGKGAHILLKENNSLYLAYHTATGKPKSRTFYKDKVDYHPYMHQFS